MKTITELIDLKKDSEKELNDKIKSIVKSSPAVDVAEKIEKLKKKFTKKLQLYNLCMEYLKTSPNESYLVLEKQRLENIIESKLKQFDYWSKTSPEARGNNIQEQQKIYAKLFDFAGMKRKIKTIEFILK